MSPTHKSIFTALVITLINQCLSKTRCNSDCMFYDPNKSVIDFDEFKHCTASSFKVSTISSKFMRLLSSTYCNSAKCGFSGRLNAPYSIKNNCCKYELVDIAHRYSYRFNHKEIV